jgi:hypothetical protein
MTNQQYRAIGFFYAFYERNLTHILNFKNFNENDTLFETYTANKSKNSFQRFLSEFRVARNVKRGCGPELLRLTLKWIKNSNSRDVDGFARKIKDKGFSHNSLTISLASKVLFLNDPYYILPYDSQVRKTVKCRLSDYKDFRKLVLEESKKESFIKCYNHVNRFAHQVEKSFIGKLGQIELIRRNRMLDLFLWSKNGAREL